MSITNVIYVSKTNFEDVTHIISSCPFPFSLYATLIEN